MSDENVSPAPIVPEFHAAMNKLAKELNEIFKPAGFLLLVFSDEPKRMNYISNSRREDMLSAMKEFIAYSEGKMSHQGNDKKH